MRLLVFIVFVMIVGYVDVGIVVMTDRQTGRQSEVGIRQVQALSILTVLKLRRGAIFCQIEECVSDGPTVRWTD